MERPAIEGDSPVKVRIRALFVFLSNAGHVKSRMKPPGPPGKAKYYLITDSEPVP